VITPVGRGGGTRLQALVSPPTIATDHRHRPSPPTIATGQPRALTALAITSSEVMSAAVACTPINIFDRLVSGMVSVTG